MKKALLPICVALFSCIASAQHNVIVVLKDGTEIKYVAEDIDSIRIDKDSVVPAEETGLLFLYDETTLTASVSGIANKKTTEAKIPSQVKHLGSVYDVTSVGSWAFSDCTRLASIEIPSSVTALGSGAFSNCTKLASIEIPSSVTKIGGGAFQYCESIRSVEIPSSVTYIGEHAFMDCTRLASVEIPSSVTFIGVGTFNNCPLPPQLLVYDNETKCYGWVGDESKCIEVSIPYGVTKIAETAFVGCSNLESIEIPGTVTEIAYSAFFDCSSLVSIEIPNSVTYIGENAFMDCTRLESIEIPSSVAEIDENAFWGCGSLKTIRVPKGCKIGEDAIPSSCEVEYY